MDFEFIGIGGVFFRTDNVQQSKAWYKKYLGMPTNDYGATLRWRTADSDTQHALAWSPMGRNTDYFAAQQQFMINYIVSNIDAVMAQMKKDGIVPVKPMETYEYGKFAWVLDAEGYQIELWEPMPGVL